MFYKIYTLRYFYDVFTTDIFDSLYDNLQSLRFKILMSVELSPELDCLTVKLRMAIQGLLEKESESIIKKITKKIKFDNLIKSLQSCLKTISDEGKMTDDSIKGVIETIQIFFSSIHSSTDDGIIFQRSIKRLHPMLEQFPLITKSELQMKLVSNCVKAYNELISYAENSFDDFTKKEVVKKASEKYQNYIKSINEAWLALGETKAPIKSQIQATMKNIEKALYDLSSISDICSMLNSIIKQIDVIHAIDEQNKKKSNRKGSRKKKNTVIEHQFVDYFKKKPCPEVLRLKEIPENRARDDEKNYMKQREDAFLSSYKIISTSYMPCKRIEEEKKENTRLKELYRASLMTAEDYKQLEEENKGLKAAIEELEEFFDKLQDKPQEKNPAANEDDKQPKKRKKKTK